MPYKIHNKQNICIFCQNELLNPEVLFEPLHQCKPACAENQRGKALFFDHDGQQLALKHYYRGGLIGRLIRDTYVGLHSGMPRMFAEFQLLRKLCELNLPVPVPVAARCLRRGPLCYRGDLVTRRIPGSVTLNEYLKNQSLSESQWRRIGAVIARFHAANVYHADLNATNILLDRNQRPWLIDFDKGCIREHGDWKFSNLERLRRSLDKFRSKTPEMRFQENDWQALLKGYGETTAGAKGRLFYRIVGVVAVAFLG